MGECSDFQEKQCYRTTTAGADQCSQQYLREAVESPSLGVCPIALEGLWEWYD